MTIRDMVARNSNYDETLDFIPTPPWATRAFYEVVAPEIKRVAHGLTAWDPAAGQGHMCKVMEEYHTDVFGSDAMAYRNKVCDCSITINDFTKAGDPMSADIILTNPPYKRLNEFIDLGMQKAIGGLGLLTRIQALEGMKRHMRFFKHCPPTKIAFFVNRIPFKSGVVVRDAPKMYFHVWIWWNMSKIRTATDTKYPPIWIPWDAQQLYEKDSDYV